MASNNYNIRRRLLVLKNGIMLLQVYLNHILQMVQNIIK